MGLNQKRWGFLFGTLLIVCLIVEFSAAGHHHKGDDDDDDDDEGCYPGRNCRPGCYCSGDFCRPYFPPHSDYLKKYQCTGYNYPKWRLWKKGSKDGSNSTVMVVVAHHSADLDSSLTSYLKENNFTTFDNYELPVPIVKSQPTPLPGQVDNNLTTTTVIDLVKVTSSSTTALPLK